MSKKWCEYCRVNIDYNRQAIRTHQESRLHQHNKEKQINHQRRQAKKEHKNTSGYTLQFEKKEGDNKPQPIPKVSEAHEKKEALMKMKAEAMDSIKSKIHTFIAQKTQGRFGADISYPEQPLLTAERYNMRKESGSDDSEDSDAEGEDEEDDLKMWRIDVCEETKKPCFINNITGAKLYEKPMGVILSEEESNRWQQLLKQIQQQEKEQEVNVGQWEEVEQNQDIFVANAVKSESSKSDDDDLQDSDEIKEDIQELRKQLLTSNTVSDQSRTMKKLIMTGKQDTVILNAFSEQTKKEEDKYQESTDNLKKLKGFMPRKRVKGMTILTGEEFE